MVCLNDKHPKIPKALWRLWRELLIDPICSVSPSLTTTLKNTLVMSPNLCFSFLVRHFSAFVSVTSEGFYSPQLQKQSLKKRRQTRKQFLCSLRGRSRRRGGGYRGHAAPLLSPQDDLQLSAKYADMCDKYSQQFIFCYYIVKSLLLRICL